MNLASRFVKSKPSGWLISGGRKRFLNPPHKTFELTPFRRLGKEMLVNIRERTKAGKSMLENLRRFKTSKLHAKASDFDL